MADSILLRVPLDDADTGHVLVEVDRREVTDDVALAAAGADGVVDATVSLAGAMRHLGPVVRTVLTQLRALGPDEFGVEFGVKLGGETGIIIAKGTAEASFTVSASWQRHSPTAAHPTAAHPTAAHPTAAE